MKEEKWYWCVKGLNWWAKTVSKMIAQQKDCDYRKAIFSASFIKSLLKVKRLNSPSDFMIAKV
ncbi:MAG: hypothetical protein ACOZAN_02845 [Patescibacteria group bacterium]